jgi:hypothetical protein
MKMERFVIVISVFEAMRRADLSSQRHGYRMLKDAAASDRSRWRDQAPA